MVEPIGRRLCNIREPALKAGQLQADVQAEGLKVVAKSCTFTCMCRGGTVGRTAKAKQLSERRPTELGGSWRGIAGMPLHAVSYTGQRLRWKGSEHYDRGDSAVRRSVR